MQPVPTVANWRGRLAREGSFDLTSFSDDELAAVGAGSPLLGLVGAEPGHDRDAIVSNLISRDLAAEVAGDSGPFLQLGGELAAVVSVRRQPALVATVAVREHEGDDPHGGEPHGDDTVLAALHGVALDRVGLFGLLEETVAPGPDRIHHFTFATPAAAAARITEAFNDLRATEQVAVTIDLFVPDVEAPRHWQVLLNDNEACLSTDGEVWQQRVPAAEFPFLFESAVRLPSRD